MCPIVAAVVSNGDGINRNKSKIGPTLQAINGTHPNTRRVLQNILIQGLLRDSASATARIPLSIMFGRSATLTMHAIPMLESMTRYCR